MTESSNNHSRWIVCLFVVVFFISGCSVPAGVSTPQDIPSSTVRTPTFYPTESPPPTPKPLATLTICTSELPESLFPYDGITPPVEEDILANIYEKPIEQLDGLPTAVILESIPAEESEDFALVPVSVQRGQPVVDAFGDLTILKPDLRVRPAGCHESECTQIWDGESPLQMDQMSLTFSLREDLNWSDGSQVTAADSVFSYQLASAPEAPGLRWAESRTQSYSAVDAHTIQWTGIPGFTTADLERFFWRPLPAHLFEGTEVWGEIAQDPRLAKPFLSYGPFRIETWESSRIVLTRNPYYFRLSDNVPFLDVVIWETVDGGAQAAWDALDSGECDVIDTSFGFEGFPDLMLGIRTDQRFVVQRQNGREWLQLVFGIQPAAYDDLYNPNLRERPDFFGDVRVRQGIALCLNQEEILPPEMKESVTFWNSFLPPSESQITLDESYPYDPAQGMELLQAAGWIDHDGDPSTARQAWNVPNVPDGTSLSLNLYADPSGASLAVLEEIQNDLGVCGIVVSSTVLPTEELFAPGPEGILFGRKFDLALLAWHPLPTLDCHYYRSTQIPNPENYWVGTNLAGLSDTVYDLECAAGTLALPEQKRTALREAELAYLDALPALPLFAPTKFIISSVSLCKTDNQIPPSSFFEMLEYHPGDKNCP